MMIQGEDGHLLAKERSGKTKPFRYLVLEVALIVSREPVILVMAAGSRLI